MVCQTSSFPLGGVGVTKVETFLHEVKVLDLHGGFLVQGATGGFQAFHCIITTTGKFSDLPLPSFRSRLSSCRFP